MSGPVTIVESGGTPVLRVEGDAPVLTAVESGGAPITLSANGAPFIIQGFTPPPAPLGPLDFASIELGVFDNFSRQYDLAAPSAVLGLCARYTGEPVIEIAHGGEPLEIIRVDKENGVLSLLAVGTGLTVESANLTITTTGGSLGGGALRINEMIDVQPEMYGWEGGAANIATSIRTPAVTGAQGGVTKIAFASAFYDPNRTTKISNATSVWQGYLCTGPLADIDLSPDGDWTLDSGWEWDGAKLVHTGAASSASVPVPAGITNGLTDGRVYCKIPAGGRLNLSVYTTGTTYVGPFEGYIYAGVNGPISFYRLTATGDVEVSEMGVVTNASNLTWLFASAPAVNGTVYTATTTARGPDNSISAAEILGEDYP